MTKKPDPRCPTCNGEPNLYGCPSCGADDSGSLSFDCIDADWGVKVVADALDVSRDSSVEIHVIPFGPGGGNPEVSVTGLSRESYEAIVAKLVEEHVGYVDADGEIQDGHC